MRRTLFAVLVSAVALAIVPATVVARGHERRGHDRRDQKREHRHHHRRHHERVRHERLGHEPEFQGDAATAGTIKSFTGGVLTITLNDGSTVSGRVTDATRIKCEAPEPPEMQGDDHGSGGDRGDQGDDRGDDQGDDQGEDQGEEQACTTADLKPNAVVQDAELEISGTGSVWEEVELASQQ